MPRSRLRRPARCGRRRARSRSSSWWVPSRDHPAVRRGTAPGRRARWSTPGARRPAWWCRARSRSPARISASTTGSTAEVASSRISTRGRRTQRPGQGDPLALAARQRHAPLADHRVVALRAARATNSSARAIRAAAPISSAPYVRAEADVVGDGLGEEERLLEHHRHRRAQLDRVDVVGVDAADAHRARASGRPGGRAGRTAWSCPSRSSRRWPPPRPARPSKVDVRRAPGRPGS